MLFFFSYPTDLIGSISGVKLPQSQSNMVYRKYEASFKYTAVKAALQGHSLDKINTMHGASRYPKIASPKPQHPYLPHDDLDRTPPPTPPQSQKGPQSQLPQDPDQRAAIYGLLAQL
ncbi:hypothetical protein Pst134EA_032287 [Puccinia striiformis f. sp. tritici]|uniref:uncharacterized protein n=1 Tax=Puccinia striiformis f. sp. tritici TaxID=168172 RepID=UPI002007802C|nr:uncharacterized protein Pst134EA_032287 [Puccinia striiformis f. sp. tritici]KAH9441797.1 hypothetical protein Pst134EA_032287 [Puccinia striiformis f. sp. tritici]